MIHRLFAARADEQLDHIAAPHILFVGRDLSVCNHASIQPFFIPRKAKIRLYRQSVARAIGIHKRNSLNLRPFTIVKRHIYKRSRVQMPPTLAF